MSATPLHRIPESRIPMVAAAISGAVAITLAVFGTFVLTTGI